MHLSYYFTNIGTLTDYKFIYLSRPYGTWYVEIILVFFPISKPIQG